MGEVRWLGPYAPKERHADKETLDYIIDLRKRLAEAERQRDNALDVLIAIQRRYARLKSMVNDVEESDDGKEKPISRD